MRIAILAMLPPLNSVVSTRRGLLRPNMTATGTAVLGGPDLHRLGHPLGNLRAKRTHLGGLEPAGYLRAAALSSRPELFERAGAALGMSISPGQANGPTCWRRQVRMALARIFHIELDRSLIAAGFGGGASI